MSQIPVLTLKPKRDKPLVQKHPWVFSGALQKIPSLPAGSIVDICSHKGEFLGRGYYNSGTSLCARVLSFAKVEINYEFILHKIRTAADFRKALGLSEKDSYRVVSSEADFLPGLIVEKFCSCIIVQVTTAGMEALLPHVEKALMEIFPKYSIVERSDDPMRKKEGLENKSRIITGDKIDPPVEIIENGLKFLTDPLDGQKTGFYLDQRTNREILAKFAKDKDVLDSFSYTGGFSIHAAAAGAKSVVAIDQSEWALDRVMEHFDINDMLAGYLKL
jgi:23S rRNA (cytosine1962-C5)-methyltransferase